MGLSIEANDIVVVEANDAFLRMLGYDREDLAAGRLSRTALTQPAWYERDSQNVAEVRITGTVLPFEKEYLRKDGSRVPVLVGIAAFDEQLDQGVAFVVDLTERNRAELESREAQMALAHANRLAAMGQLTASIGHEINQPLSGVITNAETGLLWPKAESPNLQEAVGAFSRVVRGGRRASEIVNRIGRPLGRRRRRRTGCTSMKQSTRSSISRAAKRRKTVCWSKGNLARSCRPFRAIGFNYSK